MGAVNMWRYVSLLLVFSSVSAGLYLITDYYMDDGWPSAFGQVCGKSIENDCLYVNSHLNSLGILNYGDDISCVAQLNAGNRRGARYKLKFQRFDLEESENCYSDSLAIYDTRLSNTSGSSLIGTFCGNMEPNITGYPTQQYLTLKFRTDGSTGKKGYRIMATRTLPYPCHGDYFHCKAENRCIDGRLRCDGTAQCDDGIDEDGCSFWEKLLGGFLALGLSSIVGIVFLIVLLCTGICVTICVCTCCKKQYRCCKRCCRAICKSRESGVKKLKKKIGKTKVHSKPHGEDVGKNDEVEIADERANKPTNTTTKTTPTNAQVPGSVSDTDDNLVPKTPALTEISVRPDGHLKSPTGKETLKSPTGKETVFGSNATNAGVASTLNVTAESSVTKVD